MPAGNSERFVIRIRPGVYKEQVVVPKEKSLVAFVGEDAERTVLTFDLNVKARRKDGTQVRTFESASTKIEGSDFSAQDITFENAAGPGAQALAIIVGGDRASFRRCRFLGWQDTVLTHSGRQYYVDCTIAGHVDFLFGGATAYFERCLIQCRGNGYITAASTPENQTFGYVFDHCRIEADPTVNKVYLGRPWRPYASVAFLNTAMCAAVRPEGWHNWDQPDREQTSRYSEYRSSGPVQRPVPGSPGHIP